nr:uncharacterized protein LOC112290679 isoform X2 [Physcomitrium patens]|eukprot:XP_024393006.1 uncharacterized protein LOC112290679 isoform X2 [Physcomitrella patens]
MEALDLHRLHLNIELHDRRTEACKLEYFLMERNNMARQKFSSLVMTELVGESSSVSRAPHSICRAIACCRLSSAANLTIPGNGHMYPFRYLSEKGGLRVPRVKLAAFAGTLLEKAALAILCLGGVDPSRWTSSEKPLPSESKRSGIVKDVPCTSISPQPESDEAIFEQYHVNPEYYKASIAEYTELRHGILPPREENQDTSTETTQRRSRRNRRISSFTGYLPRTTATILENHPSLSPDHPSLQRRENIMFSVYTVCLRAGRAGLTPREIMSEIRKQGLAGLEGGAAQSSKHIANLLRNSPYYMELGEGKFALCSSVIDVEQDITDQGSPIERDSLPSRNSEETEFSTGDELHTSTGSEDNVPKTGRKRKRAVLGASQPETEVKIRPGRIGRPKKLKYIKQENAETLGNQCHRNDGKGWVCPLLAKPGYQLCDHHLDKLRCKPGTRSKSKKSEKMTDEAGVTQMREELHLVDTAGHETGTPLDVSTGLEGADNFSR